MAESSIEAKVEKLLEKIISDLGYYLYDVLYVKEGKDYYLKIIIDKESGISLEDCETVNNAINDILDEADYIRDQYFLEVSSPGIERTLRKQRHFEKEIGNEILLKLFKPINKQKEVIGVLKEYNNKEIVLQVEKEDIIIDLKNIALAKTIFNW